MSSIKITHYSSTYVMYVNIPSDNRGSEILLLNLLFTPTPALVPSYIHKAGTTWGHWDQMPGSVNEFSSVALYMQLEQEANDSMCERKVKAHGTWMVKRPYFKHLQMHDTYRRVCEKRYLLVTGY